MENYRANASLLRGLGNSARIVVENDDGKLRSTAIVVRCSVADRFRILRRSNADVLKFLKRQFSQLLRLGEQKRRGAR